VSQATPRNFSSNANPMAAAATNLTMSTCQVPQDSRSEVAPIIAGTLGMVVLILCILRLLQRTVFRQIFGWDDGLIVAALLCAFPLNCLMFPCKSLPKPKEVGLTPGSAEIRPG
jgi:hypothetical protein